MSLMKFDDFVDKLRGALAAYYGTEYSIGIKKVRKNNGMLLTGITVRKRDNTIAPTVYADGFYNQYKAIGDFGSVFLDVTRIIGCADVPKGLNIDFFNEYEKVRENINLRLVNKEKNAELLKEVPYMDYLDMAAIFYYSFDDEVIKNGSILIRNEHLDMWRVTKEHVYRDALENTEKNCKPVIESMLQTFSRILAKKKGLSKEDIAELLLDIPVTDEMYVMSSESVLYGATTLLFTERFKMFADSIENNFYILPSSIHELILIPDRMGLDSEGLKEMVRCVNDTELPVDEILSYSVYFYDRAKNEVKIIRKNVA